VSRRIWQTGPRNLEKFAAENCAPSVPVTCNTDSVTQLLVRFHVSSRLLRRRTFWQPYMQLQQVLPRSRFSLSGR